uniref:NADH-ubiquinone oxidoreductase chain 5 n=1 Tax=Phasianella solida TaxID=335754 RepID=A0A0S1F5P7_9VEST|nr:NADH dehydrogenase subunit 5 [Phasianella solida]ALK03393.1 NADH dehydrogenase subunit 5 [Phasianella solida]
MPLFWGFPKMKSSQISSLFLFTYSLMLMPFTLYFFMTNKTILVEWEMLSTSTTSITVPFIFDPISISFSNLVCLISACVLHFSSSYMSGETFLTRFISLVMMFVLSMNLLVFIPSLVSLLIGWDGLGIVSFALVIYYQNMKSMAAGMLTALANRVGDVMLLLSIGLCVSQGHWNILFMWQNDLSTVLVSCIVLAAMTKSAQIPFSSWLPAAMAAPTPVSALVHSSTLVTAGVFLLIRFSPFLNTFPEVKMALLFISVLTLLMAGVGANYEYDLKKIIALSTLSQLGVMMMSISLGMSYLALFHLYTHALFKAMLFLCAGAIIHNNTNSQDIRQMGNLWSQMPLVTSCLNVANLALCGAPFMSGFYSKDLILETSLASPCNILMVLLIFLATGMTAAYSIRLSLYSLWSSPSHMPLHQNFDEDKTITQSTLILSTITVFIGSVMQNNILQFSETLILPLPHKLTTLFVTISGAWIAWYLAASPKLTPATGSKFSYFNSSMWFLSLLSTQPVIFKPLQSSGLMFKSLDQGWFEMFGGRGLFMTTKFLTKTNQTLESNVITPIMLVMTFWVALAILCVTIS